MLARVFAAVFLLLLSPLAEAGQRVVILTLKDSIQPASLRYLERGLATANAGGAALTVVELNTPGGLLVSLREMTTALTTAARPVAVYVTPTGAHAASAGFFLLLAADIAAMAPGTNTGAAHPVGGQGEELAKTLAEKAVRESASYTDGEALEHKLIDLIAKDRGELLKALEGRVIRRFDGREEKLVLDAPEIVEVGPSGADKLLSAIAHPNIAYLLLLAGIVGIYFELSHPGAIFPGVLGGISLLLALFALSVLPVNYVGVLLILLGIGFFIAEVKVTSYGLLTVAGLVSFVIGSLMLIDSPIPALRVGLEVVLPAALLVAAIVVFLLTRVLRVHRRPPLTGVEGLVGETALVVSALRPRGKVFVHGEYWEAVGTCELPIGSRGRVVRVEANYLVIEPQEEAKSSST